MADGEQVSTENSAQPAEEGTSEKDAEEGTSVEAAEEGTSAEAAAEPAAEDPQPEEQASPKEEGSTSLADANDSTAAEAQEVNENEAEKIEGETEQAEGTTDGAAQLSGDAEELPAEGAEQTLATGDSETVEGEASLANGEAIPDGDATKTEENEAEGSKAGSTPGEGDPAPGSAAANEASEEKEEVPAETVTDAEEVSKAGEGGESTKEEETHAEAAAAVPQSDTFANGENPESPAPHVGEVLSREASPSGSAPKQTSEEERTFSPPVADSPRESEVEEHFEAEVLEEEIMSPEQDREALVEMYHAAIAEREQLQQQNHQLQHKLAEYFKKKKSDEQKTESVDKNEADQEQRYLKYMSQLEELRTEDQQIRNMYKMEIEELEQRCEEKKQEVDAHRAKFVEFKHQVALNALNSRSGKPIPPKDIEQYLAAEDRKDQEVIAVRLENIKLKNKLKKKEQQLKSKEELADGLHLIDFEQLKIENQTYNEKIEERNEELLKLRKKITNTVQVLTHLKEKLQFVQGENSLLKNKLKDVEGAVAQKRDVLTRTKQARDALRIDNHRLRQNCGLLGNEPLLRDFEERKDEADALKERLERLKMQHAELTLNTSSVRRKIEQIKTTEQT